jgi:hypothetical protein
LLVPYKVFWGVMAPARKINRTVRTGMRLVAASHAYARLRQLRGKVRFEQTSPELKAGR